MPVASDQRKMSILAIILPQFLLILCGSCLKKFRQFPKSFWGCLEGLVFYVLFPPLLFLSVAKSKFGLSSSSSFLLIAVSVMLVAVFLSWLINFSFKEEAWTKWSVFHCGFRFNTYVGFAVCGPLLGDDGIALMSLLISIWVPISNTIAVIALSHASNINSGVGAWSLIKAVFTNPLILATLLGLAFNVTGATLPTAIQAFLSYLANASISLGLLCIGASLAFRDFQKYKILILACSFERLFLVPCVALAAAFILQMPPFEACVMILFAALPTAPSCYVMTSKMRGNGEAVADLTSFQTLAAMLTLSLWISLLIHLHIN